MHRIKSYLQNGGLQLLDLTICGMLFVFACAFRLLPFSVFDQECSYGNQSDRTRFGCFTSASKFVDCLPGLSDCVCEVYI